MFLDESDVSVSRKRFLRDDNVGGIGHPESAEKFAVDEPGQRIVNSRARARALGGRFRPVDEWQGRRAEPEEGIIEIDAP